MSLMIVVFFAGYSISIKMKNDTSYEKISCYDYIIDRLAEPQYWDENNIPEYSTWQLQNAALLNMPRGTGWILRDENEAVFSRGYQGILTINFSKKIAKNQVQEEFNDYSLENYQLYDIDALKVYRVFINNEKEEFVDISEFFKTSDSDYDQFNAFTEINDTFDYYEKHFSKVGCPLLGQKEGTLTAYKDVYIDTPYKEEVSTKLIHNPWEQTNWHKNVFTDESITLIEDYLDVWKLKNPVYSNEEVIVNTINGDTYTRNIFSPYFVVYTKKSDNNLYIEKDPYNSSYFEHINSYQNKLSDFMLYYVNEICKDLYNGKSCVYSVDIDNNEELTTNENFFRYNMSEEEYRQSKIIGEISVVTYYYSQDKTIAGNIIFDDVNNDKLISLAEYLDVVLLHYQKESRFSNDYIKNFGLYYNLDWQRLLGLR